MVNLLRTKLFIPRPRKDLVFRPRLVDQMNAGLDKKLTLITAPAGFGKTTLLSEWIPKSPHCVTWFSLDEGDNDPTQFWSYFIAAVQGLHPDLGASAADLLQSPQSPPIKSILTELINDLIAFSDRFACVLDDYHFIDSPAIQEALVFLVDHLPANMNLVITSREDPLLPTSRLRARNELTELRAMDLRFTREEADAFLRGVMRLELSNKDVAALEDRTEGWAVGLHLAGLSMQKQGNTQAFISDFSGSHRHVLDYLTDEVLQQQPEDVRSFLLHTAILDRLSGPLCDALTGRDDSDKLLAQLEASNLFVIPLDEERRWYRYHHLFAELLCNQLSRLQPEMVPELNRRASLWFEANGDTQSAVEHALQEYDLKRVADLIERHTLPMLYRGQVAMVVGWFDRLPQAVMDSSPMLCICKAWALVLMQRGARHGEVEQALQVADQALERIDADESLRNLVAGHAASIRAFLLRMPALMRKEPQKLIALSKEAQRLLPIEEKAIRSTTALNIGYGYMSLADLEAAGLAFKQTLEEGLSGGNYYAAIYGPINLVISAQLLGKLNEALQMCERYIDQFSHIMAGKYFPPIGALYILKGSILLEFNHLQQAEAALSEGVELVRWTGESIAPKKGYTALARLHSIQGDWQATLDTVETLEKIWPEGAFYAQALRHRLLTRDLAEDPGVRKDARSWLAQTGIEFDRLLVIDSVDPVSSTNFESYINTAHVLATLSKVDGVSHMADQAQAYLKRQQAFAEARGFTSWVVKLAIARTLLYHAAGKRNEAFETLRMGLLAGAPAGFLRIFADECSPMLALLEDARTRLTDDSLINYTDQLMGLMSCKPVYPQSGEEGNGLLSERELEVLRQLARGMSYEAIGEELFLSLNTVQFHVKNIYRKLLVNKRVHAIEKAREMKLI